MPMKKMEKKAAARLVRLRLISRSGRGRALGLIDQHRRLTDPLDLVESHLRCPRQLEAVSEDDVRQVADADEEDEAHDGNVPRGEVVLVDGDWNGVSAEVWWEQDGDPLFQPSRK
jgi:hypothetical protein